MLWNDKVLNEFIMPYNIDLVGNLYEFICTLHREVVLHDKCDI